MKKWQKDQWSNLIVRLGLFMLVLSLGTVAAWLAGERPGLALTDLANVPVQAISTTGGGQIGYAVLGDPQQPKDIYRSDDRGRTWRRVGSGLTAPITALVAHPLDASILYAGAGEPGGHNSLWRSHDGGQTWQNLNLPLPADSSGYSPVITALAVDPGQPEVLYLGTDGQGVYRFEAGPDSFELVGDLPRPDWHIKGLVVAPDSRLYALTNGGLYVTTGQSWRRLGALPGLPVSLAAAAADGQFLYAGDAASGVYRSGDGGQTWQQAADGLGLAPGAALRVTALAVDEQDPQHVAAATAYSLGQQFAASGVYESRDGGATWTRLADLKEMATQLVFEGATLYAVTAGGLKQYGQPLEARPAGPLLSLGSLARPSVAQFLILIFTVGLAALILVGRRAWLFKS